MNNFLRRLKLVFKDPDLRKKILFVLFMLALFRLGANIPIPGIDQLRLQSFLAGNQFFGFLNIFSGGGLSKLSIMMLGVAPYITATIIMQLLTMIFPKLKELYHEEGEAGRQKFNQYSRLFTVPLAALQGFGLLVLLERQHVLINLGIFDRITNIVIVIAGSVLLMWLGELITEKGIGNGVSLLIFAGIIARFPSNVRQMAITWDAARLPSYFLFFAMSLFIIAGVVLINEARRNIPISYAKRVRGMKMYGGVSTYLPMNVNPAGVMPIIFALSILLFPGMFANFFAGSAGIIGEIAKWTVNILQNGWIHGILYFLLVGIFTYFYTAVTFDPKAISENLQKMGGFVPGIRPGESTANFIHYILNRVLLIGALFLGTIAVMPSIAGGITGVMVFGFLIGGTSLLIVVAVILETVQQINAQLQMREYETF